MSSFGTVTDTLGMSGLILNVVKLLVINLACFLHVLYNDTRDAYIYIYIYQIFCSIFSSFVKGEWRVNVHVNIFWNQLVGTVYLLVIAKLLCIWFYASCCMTDSSQTWQIGNGFYVLVIIKNAYWIYLENSIHSAVVIRADTVQYTHKVV